MYTSDKRPVATRRAWAAAVLLGLLPALASAGIIEIKERKDFDRLTAPTLLSVENFEYFPTGPSVAPLVMSNEVVYSAAEPWFVIGTDGVQLTGNSLSAPRTFVITRPGINVFGMDLFIQKDDEYNVTVTTVGGDTLTISARRGDKFRNFFGVQITGDTLLGITFRSVGGSAGPGTTGGGIGNYNFDNVSIGEQVEVVGSGSGSSSGSGR